MEDTSELIKEYLKAINSMKTENLLLRGKLKNSESKQTSSRLNSIDQNSIASKEEFSKMSISDLNTSRDVLIKQKDAEISKLKQELSYEREAYGKLRSDHNKLLDLIQELVDSLERTRPFNKANTFLLEKLTEITNKITEDSKDPELYLPKHSPRSSLLQSSTQSISESLPLHRIIKRLKIIEDENSKLKSALEQSESSRQQLVVDYKTVLRNKSTKPKLRELETQADDINDTNRFLFPLNEVSEEHEEDMNCFKVNQVMNNIAQQMMNTVTELRNKKSPRGLSSYLKIPG